MAEEAKPQLKGNLITENPNLDAVVKTLTEARAFYDDPAFAYFRRGLKGKKLDRHNKVFFGGFARITALQGLLVRGLNQPDTCRSMLERPYEVDDYSNICMWYPPFYEITTNMFRTGLWISMLQVPLKVTLRTLFNYSPKADKAKAKYFKSINYDYKKKGFYYLLITGTRDNKRGKGLLKHNMLPILEKADKEGIACYLESTKESNIPIYERFGFKVVDRFELKDKIATVPIACMARLPAA
ncbi:hypothetical protein SmJEL517_g03944 [Synchytrium microbalum]|uniref:N-acetyltransferase domain-containing protein n=1 Tax=Synchytrium microbalum TaxID=1806994 RepID=A0A507BW80_9FUNG|nr:uncharacterized protein SmJEL517_g03944 [Synchytrium microbalum]TPX33097.1 hypothetical protein SmJEL517_g03944 [Synchytrium microbalum]